MSELPDFKKIEFSDMPPIPLEDVIPDASPEVSLNTSIIHIRSFLDQWCKAVPL